MLPGMNARPPLRRYRHALVACAAAAAVVWAVAAEAAPRKRGRRVKGKVVRVERKQPQLATSAHVCSLYDIDIGYCRQEVAVGDVGLVLDDQGVYGRASIRSVSRVLDACGVPVTWNIEIDTSQLTSRDYAYNAVVVFRHGIVEEGRSMPPRGAAPADRPHEQITNVIDDDGDSRGDLMVTTYPCDEPGVGTRSQRPSMTCYDTWVEHRDEWRHARTDTVAACY